MVRSRATARRLEGWPEARSVRPSFETPAARAPQDEGLSAGSSLYRKTKFTQAIGNVKRFHVATIKAEAARMGATGASGDSIVQSVRPLSRHHRRGIAKR